MMSEVDDKSKSRFYVNSSTIPEENEHQEAQELSIDVNSNRDSPFTHVRLVNPENPEVFTISNAPLGRNAFDPNQRRFSSLWSNMPMMWNNQNTLDRPPILDHYRNSADLEGTLVPRPTLMQLMHGDTIEVLDEFEKAQHQVEENMEHLNEFSLDPKRGTGCEKFVGAALRGPQGRKYTQSNGLPQSPTPPPGQKSTGRKKFGWVEGVLVRCIQSIFGIILYIRVAWVAGQAGIVMGNSIVLLASLVTTITALSTCAICTNGDVKGGGAYFLISRSLGPEFGGSIGLIFSVANAVGAAMYIVGFAETMRDLFREFGWHIIDGGMNDVRVMGLLAAIVLITIIFIGTGFESKMQMILLVVQGFCIFNYFLGTFFPPTKEQQLRGLTGYSVNTMKDNMWPVFRDGYGFFQVFSIYFPAATGIMAGANISGDLANPQKAIPKGTLWAIFGTTIVYMCIVFTTGATAVKDADGVHLPLLLTSLANRSLALENGLTIPQRPMATYFEPQCAKNSSCPYGLMNHFQIIELGSFWGPLITVGILTSSLSSALASLVGAPKVFQAVCKDKLFPYIHYFGKSYGKNEEPRRAYVLTFIVCCLIIGIGDLNLIAPIISNFFLCSYALVNYACFDCSMARTPGFRPAFKYYNKWVSLLGSIMCVTVMFVMNWITALLTFFFFALLFLYMHHRKPEVNWGSTLQAHNYRNALQSVTKLERTDEHVKNYRPQILLLTGNPAARPSLIDFFSNITKDISLLACGYIVPYDRSEMVTQLNKRFADQIRDWFKKRHVKGFYVSTASTSVRAGASSLMQTVGLGKLRPNILAMGFKHDFLEKGQSCLHEVNEYYGIIQDAFENQMGLLLLRSDELGFDFESMLRQLNPSKWNITEEQKTKLSKNDSASTAVEEGYGSVTGSSLNSPRSKVMLSMADVEESRRKFEESEQQRFEVPDSVNTLQKKRATRMTAKQREIFFSLNRFRDKVKKAVIDVWWLYDDGGLALLIPYLLTQPKSYLENAKLRVFSISTMSPSELAQEQKSMAALLAKFRINVADLVIISDYSKMPAQETIRQFLRTIQPFYGSEEGMINDQELEIQKERTMRQLRISELLREHSAEADLIVVSLPIPRKGITSGALYLSWLDAMTKDMPPTLFVRGNQQSVLTFYS